MDKNWHFKMVKTALKMAIKNWLQINSNTVANLRSVNKCTGHSGQKLDFLKL